MIRVGLRFVVRLCSLALAFALMQEKSEADEMSICSGSSVRCHKSGRKPSITRRSSEAMNVEDGGDGVGGEHDSKAGRVKPRGPLAGRERQRRPLR